MKQFIFTVCTVQKRIVKDGRKRFMQTTNLTLDVPMQVDGNIINLGYGYKTWWTSGKEDWTSPLAGETYRIHNALTPKEGDVWKYDKRTFTVGAKSGFVCYTAPLYENGRQVATIKFEDYYKD